MSYGMRVILSWLVLDIMVDSGIFSPWSYIHWTVKSYAQNQPSGCNILGRGPTHAELKSIILFKTLALNRRCAPFLDKKQQDNPAYACT